MELCTITYYIAKLKTFVQRLHIEPIWLIKVQIYIWNLVLLGVKCKYISWISAEIILLSINYLLIIYQLLINYLSISYQLPKYQFPINYLFDVKQIPLKIEWYWHVLFIHLVIFHIFVLFLEFSVYGCNPKSQLGCLGL